MDCVSSSDRTATGGRRDLFLSYHSTDRDAILRLRQHLERSGISTFYDRSDLSPGQPWLDELESALRSVQAVAIFIGPNGIGAIQKREMQFALARQADEERAGRLFSVIPVLLEGADPDAISSFLALNTWVDLRRGLEDDSALASLRRAIGRETSTKTDAALTICPYRGLNAFREEDAPLFFGRNAAASEVFQKVLKNEIVTVIGRSGSGKSSVTQAGLLPLLRLQKPPETTWETVILTPGGKPFHRLAVQLVPIWSPGKDRTDIRAESEKLGDMLAGGISLTGFIEEALRNLPNTDRLLLVIDQLEELFTLTPSREVQRRFLEQLLAAARESPLTVLFTLRADFYGQAIGASPELGRAIVPGIVNIVEMSRQDLRHAIVEPARRTGLQFEAGLVDRILDNVEQQPGGLPLLEYALTELWQRRSNGLLGHASYDAIGGVDGAISKRAEAQFEKLSPAQQAVALPALSRLVRVSSSAEEGADVRQVVGFNELSPDGQAVMRIFAQKEARLVVTGRDDSSSSETVQVAHEALIRGWDRLRQCIEKNREFLVWRQQLRPFLEKWRSLGYADSTLLQGVYLLEARTWLRDRGTDLNEEEQRFIRASEGPDLKVRRSKQIAATAALLLLAAGTFWFWWSRRDVYQIGIVLRESPELVVSAGDSSVGQSAVREWLVALTYYGMSAEAISASRRPTDPETKSAGLTSLARALALVGRVQESRDAARESVSAAAGIAHGGLRQTYLTSVPLELLRVGDFEGATSLLHDMGDVNDRMAGLRVIARELGWEGKAEEAMRVVQQIENPDVRDFAHAEAVRMLAIQGKPDAGLEILGQFQNRGAEAYAKAGLAEGLTSAGRMAEAGRLAAQALGAAEKFHVEPDRTHTMVWVAQGLAAAGDESDALKVSQQIKSDRGSYVEAVTRSIRALTKSGKIPEAIAFAQETYTGEDLLAMHLQILAEAGRFQDLQDTAQALKSRGQLPVAKLNGVIEALINGGNPQGAVAVMHLVGPTHPYPELLTMAAEALMKAGKTAEAGTAAAEALTYFRQSDIHNIAERNKTEALATLMRVLGRTGRHADFQMAASMALAASTAQGFASHKSEGFADVAKAYASAHLYRQARLTAERCADAGNQLSAYAAILREYTIQARPDVAKLFGE
jgi:hypothetical protein